MLHLTLLICGCTSDFDVGTEACVGDVGLESISIKHNQHDMSRRRDGGWNITAACHVENG